jgi:hypothetical protein
MARTLIIWWWYCAYCGSSKTLRRDSTGFGPRSWYSKCGR